MPKNIVIDDIHIIRIVLEWDSQQQKVRVVTWYSLVDDDGNESSHQEIYVSTLTAQQQNMMNNFVVNSLIPAIKAKEGI